MKTFKKLLSKKIKIPSKYLLNTLVILTGIFFCLSIVYAGKYIRYTNGRFEITDGDNLTVSGNVGIGTENPARPLHINGAIRLTAGSEPSSPSLGDIYVNSSDKNLYFYNGTSWDDLTATGGGSLWTAEEKYIYANNATNVVVTNDGRVGIGKTDPGYKLDIRETAGEGGAALIRINQDNSTPLYTGLRLDRQGQSEKWFIGMNDSDDKLRFRRNSSSDDLVIDTSGNVGIGTVGPSGLLDVNYNSGELRLRVDQDELVDTYNLGVWTGDGRKIILSSEQGKIRQAMVFGDTGGTETFFGLSTSQDGGNTWNPRFVVKQNGNVGIGTTEPGNKLEVAGNVEADGFTINGVPVGTSSDSYWSASSG
ncbi:hypothetical protein J7L85_05445, partial [candidate division WOR-3 bacterium]|nr:hypothetical protein [candidate division WOR-3 bacterium]